MTQNTELEAVKRKIRALTAKTVEAGASEAEAEFAMLKVSELLTAFNLTLNEVLLKEQAYVTKEIHIGSSHLGVGNWVATGIAKYTDTKVWTSRHRGTLSYFGMESDVEMAAFLYATIESAYQRSYAEFKLSDTYKNYEGHRKTLNSNFMAGFGSRLNARLNTLFQERKDAERKAAAYHAEKMKNNMIEMSTETAVKIAEQTTGTSLALVDKAKNTEKEFEKLGMKLGRAGASYRGGRYNPNGREAGSNAANKVNLSRPIGGGSTAGFGGYLK